MLKHLFYPQQMEYIPMFVTASSLNNVLNTHFVTSRTNLAHINPDSLVPVCVSTSWIVLKPPHWTILDHSLDQQHLIWLDSWSGCLLCHPRYFSIELVAQWRCFVYRLLLSSLQLLLTVSKLCGGSKHQIQRCRKLKQFIRRDFFFKQDELNVSLYFSCFHQ